MSGQQASFPAAGQQAPFPPPGPQAPVPAPAPQAEGKGLKRAVIGVVVLAVLAVVGFGGAALFNAFGGSSLPSAAGGDSKGEQLLGDDDVTALLDGRTRALKAGDEETFLKPFSGQARTEQQKIYRNLRKIPFASAEYQVVEQSGSGSNEYGDGATIGLDVAFVHKIENVDVAPVAEWYRWTIKRASKEAAPQITKVGGSPSAYGEKGFVYYPAAWDVYDDMFVQRQDHSITISASKNAADARRFAPIVEQSARDDVQLWQRHAPSEAPSPQGFVFVLEPDRKTYATLYTSNGDDPGWDAGASVPMPTFTATVGSRDAKELQFGGARIKMDTSSGRFTSAQWQRGVRDITHHEVAHALMQPLDQGKYGMFNIDDGPRTWVVEGFAEWVSSRFDPALSAASTRGLRGMKFDGELPENDFEGQLGRTVSQNYTLSSLAVQFVAEKRGEEGVFDLVSSHYQDPKHLDQQLQKVLGMDESAFASAWADYVRRSVQ
ncbi:hypothetical protein [Streptomyces sp. NPDC003077]|uniref:hypothetical protein n=1 Tax=Streptomyces sp. NPDC003077 TaxID=3154443 RepID=UPI0033A4897B